jgi:hypothetical protein
MCWVVYDLHRRVRHLEDSRPTISTRVLSDPVDMVSDGLVVEVRNDGADGKFQAQIEVTHCTEYVTGHLKSATWGRVKCRHW